MLTTTRKLHEINIFDINRLFDHKLITETSKSELIHTTPIYVEFGATRACFVTQQGQEPINRKIRNLEHRNRRGVLNPFIWRSTVLHLGIIIPSLILILQALFNTISFRVFYVVLERLV